MKNKPKKKSLKNKPKKKSLLFYLMLGSLFTKLLAFVFRKKQKHDPHLHWEKIGEKLHKIKHDKSGEKHVFRDFIESEESKIEKFIFEKKSFIEFFKHIGGFLKDLFIPHAGNNHKPKVLRPKSLLSITVGFIIIKLFLACYLFLAYPEGAFMSENIGAQVIEFINVDREKNNIAPLNINPELTRAAKAKAEDMVANNYFDHYGPDGKKPWEWIHRTDYDYIFAGENLAMNFTTAKSVHAALMNSESHRKNILSDKYQDIGVAMVSGEIEGKKTNILVETFGRKRKPRVIAKEIKVVTKPVVEKAPVVEKEAPVEEVSEVDAVGGAVSAPPKDIEDIEPAVTVKNAPKEEPALTADKEIPVEQGSALAVNSVEKVASTSASSSLDIKKIAAVTREVSMVVRDVEPTETKVLAEKNYLDIDNNTLVTVKASPEIVGRKAILTHKKMLVIHYVFIVLVAVMGLLLAINIFVKIRVQHKSVIVQTLFTIGFIVALIFLKLHYMENDLVDILLM